MPSSDNSIVLLQSLIDQHRDKLKTLEQESREHRAMLKSLFESDENYQEVDREWQKLNKLKKIARQKILATPEAKAVDDKVKANQAQIRELKTAFSDYLYQYATQSGSNQIEFPDGSLKQIVYTAKLANIRE